MSEAEDNSRLIPMQKEVLRSYFRIDRNVDLVNKERSVKYYDAPV